MARFALDSDSVPTVNPSGGPAARQNIDVSSEMFGGSIGRAMGTLGQGIEKASSTGFQALEAQDTMEARTHAAELHTWQSDATTDAQEKFLALKGRAAIEALPEFKKQVTDIHQRARDQ